MEARLHGPGPPAQSTADLVDREVGPEPENDDGPKVQIQAGKSRDELVLVDEPAKWIGGGPICRFVADRNEPNQASPARSIATHIDEDPIEPGLEVVGLPDGSGRRPCTEKRVVRGVGGVARVPEDQAGHAIGAVELAVGEPDEPVLDLLGLNGVQDLLPDAAANQRPSPFQTSDDSGTFGGHHTPVDSSRPDRRPVDGGATEITGLARLEEDTR